MGMRIIDNKKRNYNNKIRHYNNDKMIFDNKSIDKGCPMVYNYNRKVVSNVYRNN